MDPATITVIVKALDLAFLAGMYLMERAQSEQEYADGQTMVVEASKLRAMVESGLMTEAQLESALDKIKGDILAPMHAALRRL